MTMTQGRDEVQHFEPTEGAHTRSGSRALTPFDDPEPIAPVEEDQPTDAAIDPWGAQDPRAFAPRREGVFAHSEADDDNDEPEPDQPPAPRRRGGGILTIPLLCIGVATIACVTLLPIADENHQLAWERQK